MSTRIFPAVVETVYDGDTVNVLADLGMAVWRYVAVRLDGINARELRDPGGKEARDYLLKLMPLGSKVTLISVGWDKYGDRVDGRITLSNGHDVAADLVGAGYAALWDGRGERPVPPWPIPAQS